MICSSVNLVRFIVRPQVGPDSNRRWRKNPVAGHDLTPQRADDGPAYVTILVVGHLMGFALPVFFESFRDNPLLVACLLSAASIALALLMLPPVKGMFVAFQWAKGMHGFGRTASGPAISQETRCAGDC